MYTVIEMPFWRLVWACLKLMVAFAIALLPAMFAAILFYSALGAALKSIS